MVFGARDLEEDQVNEERVDRAFELLNRSRSAASTLSIAEVSALAERVRLEIILDKSMSGARKRWYRAYSDYLDEAVEERMDKANIGRGGFREDVLQYVRSILDDE